MRAVFVQHCCAAVLLAMSPPTFANPVVTNAVTSAGTSAGTSPVINAVTPSDVYQQAEWAIAEINNIRLHMKVTDIPRVPGVQVNKKPLHVYAKSLEVLEKIARIQKEVGLQPVKLGHIPIRKITPTDVLELSHTILSELGRIKSKLGLTLSAAEPVWVAGKKPSEVYERMWQASYLLDGVAGQINPSYVFRNTRIIVREIERVASTLDVALDAKAFALEPGKSPKDVNLQGFKNLHHIARLQRKLKIDPIKVPRFPAGNISASDVYDTTNTMLAELVRIKIALGISAPRDDIPVVGSKTPSDVLSQMRLIGAQLQILARHNVVQQAARQ